jgi:2-iminoacetate synthase ThiH
MENHPRPSMSELLSTIALARSIMPEMDLQVPPNLLICGGSLGFERAVRAVLLAGATDFGGISSITPDFINPTNPWPSIDRLKTSIERAGFIPRERLPIYPRYTKNPEFMSDEVRNLVLKLADQNGYRC